MAIKIGNHLIADNAPPFIIAEMSGNHNQSLEKALSIVDAAAATGAHALKIQTYTADTMTLNLKENEFFINDPNSLWKGVSLYDLYKRASTPYEWHKAIMDRCKEKGILFFSTPFDESAVDFLENLDVPLYKVASFENTDLPLIRKIATTGKPLILSTGMATLAEIDETVRTFYDTGGTDLILLKCTSSYPATPAGTNIMTIPHLKNIHKVVVGLSDHTLGTGVAVASIALGARVVEKHFTLDRSEGGVDSAFSLEPAEFKNLVDECTRAWEALGTVQYGSVTQEKNSQVFRRSLYIAEDIKAGEILTEKNLRRIRPGKGLAPKYYEICLGKKVNRDVKKGTPMSWDLL